MEKKFFRKFGWMLFFTLAGLSRSVLACQTLADCEARKTVAPFTMTQSCCTCYPPGDFTPAYTDTNECLCNNGFASYCGASPSPPGTCAGAGYANDPGGLCPGDPRCTGIVLGGKKCVCAVGEFWDVDYCAAGAPPPPPPPPPPACGAIPPASWDTHNCGTGGNNCWDSVVPPPVQAGVTFSKLTNKMAACCGIGWGETPASLKFDCVEAVAPTTPSAGAFLAFYNFGATADPLTTGGLTYPNQVFVTDKNEIPINGFYDQSGHRCNYREAGAGATATKKLSAPDQMALFRTALAEMKIPDGTNFSTKVDDQCCALVVLALERKCPEGNLIGGVQVAVTDSGTRRCSAAKEMKLDFAVFDLCDPTVVKRSRFRMATSFAGEDPTKASVVANASITIQGLINQFYPAQPPLSKPICPASPQVIYEFPWSGGMCRLKAPEAPYTNYPNP